MKNQKLKRLIAAKANLLQNSSEATFLNDDELMRTLGGFAPCGTDGCGSNICGSQSCGTNVCGTQACGTKSCTSNA